MVTNQWSLIKWASLSVDNYSLSHPMSIASLNTSHNGSRSYLGTRLARKCN
jgi:hypothetical protein